MTLIWLSVIAAALGLCVLLCALSALRPDRSADLFLSPFDGENAERLLRAAVAQTQKAGGAIYAVCLDEEAVKICEIMQREYPLIYWRRMFSP